MESEIKLPLKSTGKLLIPLKPGGTRTPLFIVPAAVGITRHYRKFVKQISPKQPVYMLGSLGADGKDKPLTSIEDIASHNIKEIISMQPEGPYLLGGRCFGGRVAYEMAQQMTKAGMQVSLLLIFDTWAPFEKSDKEKISQEKEKTIANYEPNPPGNLILYHLNKGNLINAAKNYSSRKIKKFKKNYRSYAKFYFGTPGIKRQEHIRKLHIRAQDNYEAKKYPGKIILFESGDYQTETRERWKRLALGGFESHSIPGSNHLTIANEPFISILTEKLNSILDNANRSFVKS